MFPFTMSVLCLIQGSGFAKCQNCCQVISWQEVSRETKSVLFLGEANKSKGLRAPRRRSGPKQFLERQQCKPSLSARKQQILFRELWEFLSPTQAVHTVSTYKSSVLCFLLTGFFSYKIGPQPFLSCWWPR